MGDAASLITALAGLVTAIGGVATTWRITSRMSPRERKHAARRAVDRYTAGDDDDEWYEIEPPRRRHKPRKRVTTDD